MVALSWRSRLSEDEADEARTLLDVVTEADGRPPVAEAALLRVRHGREDTDERGVLHLLARAASTEVPKTGVPTGEHAGGGLVGYAQLAVGDSGGGTAELAVLPEYRRRGVGGELVRALLDRSRGRTLRVWAHGEHPAATRLAQRYGFTVARSLWRMGRSLLDPPLAQPNWPDGVRVRPFRVGVDEAAFVEVNNRAFAGHPEQGGWDVEQVRAREALPWFDPAGFLLAVEPDEDAATDRILGFHWTKVHSAELGEVYVLGVDPAEHGRGLGAALTLAGLHHLRDRGMTTVMLYVEGDNGPAIRTYKALGFTRWDTDVVYSSP
jgi:mycothiol synthase